MSARASAVATDRVAAPVPTPGKGRIGFADLDEIRRQLASDDVTGDDRRAIVERLRNELRAQEMAWRLERIEFKAEPGTWNEPLADAVKGLIIEEENRERSRFAQGELERSRARMAAADQARAERLARWSALSPIERALFLIADRTGREEFALIAQWAGDANTANPQNCPRSFEPV